MIVQRNKIVIAMPPLRHQIISQLQQLIAIARLIWPFGQAETGDRR